ncbi:MAG: thermonuclease family protein [Candidatus Gottesmanbacteria bacterium]|nr:thermonuclease family protein [Candidatus Gottesmanbacteria bacterium]
MRVGKTAIPWFITIPILLALIPSLILNAVLLGKKAPDQIIDPGVMVEGVIDGDTIVVEPKTRVRLRHIDAPELEFCGGKEAKEALEKLVTGKRVRITEQVPDQRGRGMAFVYVGAVLVNKELLAQGLVRFHHDTSTRADELKALGLAIKTAKQGIFGACQSTVNIKNPKCNIKGNIDRLKKIYHVPGCTQYPFAVVEEDIGEQWFCTEKEAKSAGYTKSERCENVGK